MSEREKPEITRRAFLGGVVGFFLFPESVLVNTKNLPSAVSEKAYLPFQKNETPTDVEQISRLAEIYLRDARSNVISVSGRQVIVPSRIYANGIYARDAFFSVVGLADIGLSEESFRFFEENINQVNGQVPTAVAFNPEDQSLSPQDDETNLLYIIWSGILAREGISVDRSKVEQAYQFVKTHIKDGFYISPAGPFRYWADTVSPERPERIAYNQGFYALALRMLLEMDLAGVKIWQLEQAKTNYRSFYRLDLGYLGLGKDSSFANAQDLSALMPEFFSHYFFQESMFSDEAVLATVNHHLKTASVRLSDGRLGGIKIISSPWGSFLPAKRFFVSQLNQPGNYQNGGYWPMHTLLELSLSYKISPREPYKEAITQLLQTEMAQDSHSKEFLILSPGNIGGFDPNRSVYSWNALAYRALSWAGLINR